MFASLSLVSLALLGCGEEPPPPQIDPALAALEDPAPTGPEGRAIAVSVPLTGPSAALGQLALDGVRLAVPPGLQVVAIDEQQGDPVPQALADERVVGVVAHVTEVGAERWAGGWAATDLAVVMAAPATVPDVPRVLAGADRHVRCASAFLGRGRTLIVHDGTAESTNVSNAAERVLGGRSQGIRVIDPRLMANEASRVRAAGPDWIVYTGSPASGGNLLRALRQLGGDAQFLGVGLYDPRFVAAAGEPGEGALVTSQDRPAVDEQVVQRWRSEHRTEPATVALNAYDAARLLVEAWATAEVPDRAQLRSAVKARLRQVEVSGAAGAMKLDDEGVVEPAWCTAFRVRGGALALDGVARVIGHKVETVDLAAERAALQALRAAPPGTTTAEGQADPPPQAPPSP
ncbi:ABC transporter substrate-binding protein [Myxococcota bacterium]|nr:ABC transporter substrate-binding protein [Myxococcota bacterium]